MIRYTILSLIIFGLCGYAWKDWYKGLCGLIVLMAIVHNENMPTNMFGVPGLNPWNMVFLNIMGSWFTHRKKEALVWDMPRGLTWLLWSYFIIIFIAILRNSFDMTPNEDFAMEVGAAAPKLSELWVDQFLNSLKWILPSLLLFVGCNSRERFNWAILALILMYLALSLLVIRWMPLGLLVDGNALQRRAAKVLDQNVGYYRTNLSVMLAGGFWVFIGAAQHFGKKYSLLLYLLSGLVLLAMILTGGRGGYVAWAVVGVLVSMIRYRKMLVTAPLVIILIISFVPSVQERLMLGMGDKHEESNDKQYAELSEEESGLNELSAGRTLFWPLVIEQIKNAPFFGHGYFAIITTGASLEFYKKWDFPYYHPHNAYLQLIVDNGIFLAFPIFIFHLIMLKYAWSLFRDTDSSIYVLAGTSGTALVLTFLLGSLSGQSFYPEERSFGMWCCMMLMLRVYVERKKVWGKGVVRRRTRKSKEPPKVIWDE